MLRRGKKGVKIMNKTTMWIVGAVVLVVIGGGLFITNQNSKQSEQAKMEQEKAAMMQKENTAAEEKETMMKKQEGDKMMADKNSSRYVVYSKAAYDGASDKRRVLYFYATWCPSCKQANEDFTANPNKIRRMWL